MPQPSFMLRWMLSPKIPVKRQSARSETHRRPVCGNGLIDGRASRAASGEGRAAHQRAHGFVMAVAGPGREAAALSKPLMM